jgi:putative membrane protein
LVRGSQRSSIEQSSKKIVMDNEAIHQSQATQPDPRVQLAFERTFLAYERTRIAWVRTALALISFGFVIAKFFQYLREKQGETATVLSPRAIGLLMIIIGLVGLILANWQERRALKALRARCPELPQSISGVMAMLITLFGVLALIGALLR